MVKVKELSRLCKVMIKSTPTFFYKNERFKKKMKDSKKNERFKKN